MTNDTYPNSENDQEIPNDENDQEINLPDQSNIYDPNSVLTYDDSNPQNPVEPDTDETEPVGESIPSELEIDSVPDQPNSNDSEADREINDVEAPSYDINPNSGQSQSDNQQRRVGDENANSDAYNQNLDESGT